MGKQSMMSNRVSGVARYSALLHLLGTGGLDSRFFWIASRVDSKRAALTHSTATHSTLAGNSFFSGSIVTT